jgi:hypothetical protein
MLIEERQPLQSIGETSAYSTRGTVKGLRRPSSSSTPLSEDDFSTPDNNSLYSNFLTTKNVQEEEHIEHEDISETKKQKVSKEKKNAVNDKGLARFMQNKQ